jgi:hypothetical protein
MGFTSTLFFCLHAGGGAEDDRFGLCRFSLFLRDRFLTRPLVATGCNSQTSHDHNGNKHSEHLEMDLHPSLLS